MTSGLAIVYWNFEEIQKVNFYVETHNQYIKTFGETINEVGKKLSSHLS